MVSQAALCILVEVDPFADDLQRARLALDFTIAKGWRFLVDRARVALGARCATLQVSEGEWLEHWRAGMDPVSAVLAELED